jgi:hypothetical protein
MRIRHVLTKLRQRCRQIFYPPAKLPDGTDNPLRDPAANMWLTTCGIQPVQQGECRHLLRPALGLPVTGDQDCPWGRQKMYC